MTMTSASSTECCTVGSTIQENHRKAVSKIGRRCTPNYRKDLNIVVHAPDGSFAAYCGMWYEATNSFVYVEPVRTDPDYRGMGLGTAAVLEGIGRCGEEGATVAYVGSDQPFYLEMGFEKLFDIPLWAKQLAA